MTAGTPTRSDDASPAAAGRAWRVKNGLLIAYALAVLVQEAFKFHSALTWTAPAGLPPGWAVRGPSWVDSAGLIAFATALLAAAIAYRRRRLREPPRAPGVPTPWRSRRELRAMLYVIVVSIVLGGVRDIFGRGASSLGSPSPIEAAFIVAWNGVCAAGIVWYDRRRLELEDRAATGRCHACGYDLRATPERCPECGAIRSDDPKRRRAHPV